MNFLIESHLKGKTEEISFVQLKPGAGIDVKSYEIPEEGLYVPFLTIELANNIKTRNENEILTVGGMVRGMIFTLGVDSEFKYKDEYVKFLKAVVSGIEEYILYHGAKLVDEGRLLEGIIYFKALATIEPGCEDAVMNYCITLLRYAEEEKKNNNSMYILFKREAKEKLEQLFKAGYDLPLVNYYLGLLASEDKQYLKAQSHWVMVLEQSQNEELKEHVGLLLQGIEDLTIYETGYEAILAGNPQKGLPLLEKLEGTYEEWWNLLFFIGLGLRQLGEYEEAIGYFDRVLGLKPDQTDAMVEMSICLSCIGDNDEAVEGFLRAIEVGGENNEVLSNLAIAYMELGDYPRAKECIERSLELQPEDEIAQLCQRKLNQLMKQ